jgi:uncharacterized protein YciI
MNKYLIILAISFACMWQNSLLAQSSETAYDSTLAKSLGADDYGMKMYVFVILKTGTNTITDTAIRDSLFVGHFANMSRMAEAGKLVVAGPMEKNDREYRGIFILDVPDFATALALLQNDPTIKEKVLVPEMYHWYGSAALPMYLDDHKKIQAKKIE